MVLKRLLGGGKSEHEETYDLNWLGKRRALRLINAFGADTAEREFLKSSRIALRKRQDHAAVILDG